MSYKTIVVHCDASKSIAARLGVAADLAKRYQAHLVGVHARPPFVPPVFAGGSYNMGAFFNQHEASVKASEAAASADFAKAVKGSAITSEWHSVDGRADELLASVAREADLTIVGQFDPEGSDLPSPSDLPESVAFASARGVLVIPYVGCETALGDRVMLCWNASRESARAASEALPLLKAARAVTVLLVEPRTSSREPGAMQGAGVKAWLNRHGVEVSVQMEVAVNDDVGSVILSRAAELGIDIIVMGIYGHSRLREMVLGGASRTMLASLTVPVFMAH